MSGLSLSAVVGRLINCGVSAADNCLLWRHCGLQLRQSVLSPQQKVYFSRARLFPAGRQAR